VRLAALLNALEAFTEFPSVYTSRPSSPVKVAGCLQGLQPGVPVYGF